MLAAGVRVQPPLVAFCWSRKPKFPLLLDRSCTSRRAPVQRRAVVCWSNKAGPVTADAVLHCHWPFSLPGSFEVDPPFPRQLASTQRLKAQRKPNRQ